MARKAAKGNRMPATIVIGMGLEQSAACVP